MFDFVLSKKFCKDQDHFLRQCQELCGFPTKAHVFSTPDEGHQKDTPGLLMSPPRDWRAETGRSKDTWENTMTLPVSSFTVWMVPWTTAVPTTLPVTCPLLLTTATV